MTRSLAHSYLRRVVCPHRLVIIAAIWVCSGCSGSGVDSEGAASHGGSLEDLPLSVVQLVGQWRESDPFFDDSHEWRCAAGVLQMDAQKMILVTSSTCLGLRDLVEADTNAPEIEHYQIKATFHGHQSMLITRIGEWREQPELCLLAIDQHGLSVGQGVELLAPRPHRTVALGDEAVTVVVGEGDLATCNFGRITGRQLQPMDQTDVTILTADLNIALQEDGSPLFVKQDDTFWWAGVVLAPTHGGRSTTCVEVGEIKPMSFSWFPGDENGVAALLDAIYGIEVEAAE